MTSRDTGLRLLYSGYFTRLEYNKVLSLSCLAHVNVAQMRNTALCSLLGMIASGSGCGGSQRTAPMARIVAERVVKAIAREFEFDEQETTALDYACGTGESPVNFTSLVPLANVLATARLRSRS